MINVQNLDVVLPHTIDNDVWQARQRRTWPIRSRAVEFAPPLRGSVGLKALLTQDWRPGLFSWRPFRDSERSIGELSVDFKRRPAEWRRRALGKNRLPVK